MCVLVGPTCIRHYVCGCEGLTDVAVAAAIAAGQVSQDLGKLGYIVSHGHIIGRNSQACILGYDTFDCHAGFNVSPGEMQPKAKSVAFCLGPIVTSTDPSIEVDNCDFPNPNLL